MNEPQVKEHVLRVFHFGVQLQGCARSLNPRYKTLIEFLNVLCKKLEIPLVDTSTKDVLHLCRHILETMITYLLSTANINGQAMVSVQLRWLATLPSISKFPHKLISDLGRWCDTAKSIMQTLNVASHARTTKFLIKDVLYAISSLHILIEQFASLDTCIKQCVTQKKLICRYYINKGCSNRTCTFAHTTYL